MKKIVSVVWLLSLAGIVSAQTYSYPGHLNTMTMVEQETSRQHDAGNKHIVESGITQGDNMFSFMLGGAFPLGDSGVDVEESSKPKWGGNGLEYGLSYLYFVNEYLGLGVEIRGMNTANASKRYSGSLGYGTYSELYKTKMDLFNFMITGRLNANPHEKARVYFPFGFGLTSARGTFKVDGFASGGGSFVRYNESYKATTSSLGYFIGVGAETNLDDANNWTFGAELRYNGFTFDTDKLVPDTKLNGKQHYGYMSLLLKLGYRF